MDAEVTLQLRVLPKDLATVQTVVGTFNRVGVLMLSSAALRALVRTLTSIGVQVFKQPGALPTHRALVGTRITASVQAATSLAIHKAMVWFLPAVTAAMLE